MGWMEFALLIVGAVILIISFAIPAGKAEKNGTQTLKIDEGMIKDLVEREVRNVKGRMDGMVEETLSYSMEKTERAMERMANEKIMAIHEYSEQVLTAINKNHQEVMFLYDMLNDKHTHLVNTVSEASQKAKEIRQTVQDAEITVKEAVGIGMAEGENAAGKAGMAARPESAGKAEAVVGKAGMAVRPENAGRVETVAGAGRLGETAGAAAKGEGKVGAARNLEATAGITGMVDRPETLAEAGRNGGPEAAEASGGPEAGTGLSARQEEIFATNIADRLSGTAGAETDSETEFTPIAPKRVELVNGMLAQDGMENAFSASAGNVMQTEPGTEDGKGHNNNEKILRLHKLGKSKTAIAKELGLGVGEVKLVIDLFEQ